MCRILYWGTIKPFHAGLPSHFIQYSCVFVSVIAITAAG
jgi:hypothetical protein